MKPLACLLAAALGLSAACCGLAEESYRFDASREVAAYLDEAGVNYTQGEGSENYDLFMASYAPSASEELEQIVLTVSVYEDHAMILSTAVLQPDTSDMLKLYQNLESVNESLSFIRLQYDPDLGVIYPQADVPYVADAAFGRMVERYMYITALLMDENYDGLAVLFQ